mgnify:CR=1 FL=1
MRKANISKKELENIWQELKKHPEDWLAAVEILEISNNDSLNAEIITQLKNAADEVTQSLIKDSLSLIK